MAYKSRIYYAFNAWYVSSRKGKKKNSDFFVVRSLGPEIRVLELELCNFLAFSSFLHNLDDLLICQPTKFFKKIPEEVSFLKSPQELILMKKLMTFFFDFCPPIK